jgi:hypothetical protein
MNIGVEFLLPGYLWKNFKLGPMLLTLSTFPLEELNSLGVMVGVELDTLKEGWTKSYAINPGWTLVVFLLL